MISFVKKIQYLSNWKVTLTIGILTFVFYLFVGMFTNFLLSEDLLHPHRVLQSQFNYSNQNAFEILNSYSHGEKSTLMKFTIPCDFLIALLYGLFLTLSLIGIYKYIVKDKYLYFFLFPIISSIFNMLENVQILYMLSRLDKVTIYNLASITNIFTMSKLLLLQASILLVFIGLIVLLIKKIIKSRKVA